MIMRLRNDPRWRWGWALVFGLMEDYIDEVIAKAEARGRLQGLEEADLVLREHWHRIVHECGLQPGSVIEKFAAEVLNAIRARISHNKGGE